MIKIRKFRKQDALKVSNLIRKTLKEINSKFYPKRVIEFLWGYFNAAKIIEKSKQRSIFIVTSGKKIIGTGSLEKNILRTVFIHPEFEGKGIGTVLLNHLEKIARKRRYKTIVVPSSINAVGFYAKHKYRKVKTSYDRNTGNKAVIMKKKI